MKLLVLNCDLVQEEGEIMEIWKPVVGYEGIYEVSSYGRVRSLTRDVLKSNGVIQHRSGRLKELMKNKDGYLLVSLNKGGRNKKQFVHRLVAAAFIQSNLFGLEVDHIDFNRSNNRVENLRVLDHTENVRHTKAFGRHVSDRGFSGSNNPNFGSKTLSKKYKENPSLSKEKQSRPGGQNGRARRVLMDVGGTKMEFSCLHDCAKYLVKSGMSNANNLDSLSTRIRKFAESGRGFSGIKFQLT